MKKNDLIEILIDDITIEGQGVGKVNDIVIFVPETSVGDKIIGKILKVKKNYAYAKAVNFLSYSKDRIEIDCPYFPKCGGCTFRHISYESELKIKQKTVDDCIKRIGGFKNIISEPIIRSDKINNYRNKVQIPISTSENGDIISGFYQTHSHRIINISKCKLQPEIFQDIINCVISWMKSHNISGYNEERNAGIIRHIYIRSSENIKEIMVCIVINNNELPYKDLLVETIINNFPMVKGIFININQENTNVILGNQYVKLWGEDYITDKICNLKFNISPNSFYQVNRAQAEKLYEIAKKYAELNPDDILLDLYCGTGTIGLCMSHNIAKLIGIEIVESAINDAKNNAIKNNIYNSYFIHSDASNTFQELKTRNIKPNIIILDPPRKGCSQELIKDISEMFARNIIYISCNPSTLARDLKKFNDYGYSPIKIVPIDLFPRTGHVETVCLLSKLKTDLVKGNGQ